MGRIRDLLSEEKIIVEEEGAKKQVAIYLAMGAFSSDYLSQMNFMEGSETTANKGLQAVTQIAEEAMYKDKEEYYASQGLTFRNKKDDSA